MNSPAVETYFQDYMNRILGTTPEQRAEQYQEVCERLAKEYQRKEQDK